MMNRPAFSRSWFQTAWKQDTQGAGHHEQGRGLHLAGLDAQPLPALPFLEKVVVDRGLFGAVLAVEGILALDNTHMIPVAQIIGGLLQGAGDAEIAHGGKLDGGILQRGVLIADGTVCDDHIAGQHIHVDTAAGAHPDEGVRADGSQLLHGDGGRGAADAGGADGNLLTVQISGVYIVFPVHADVNGVLKMRRNRLAPPGIAGQEHIPAHIPLLAADVKLHTDVLHIITLSSE